MKEFKFIKLKSLLLILLYIMTAHVMYGFEFTTKVWMSGSISDAYGRGFSTRAFTPSYGKDCERYAFITYFDLKTKKVALKVGGLGIGVGGVYLTNSDFQQIALPESIQNIKCYIPNTTFDSDFTRTKGIIPVTSDICIDNENKKIFIIYVTRDNTQSETEDILNIYACSGSIIERTYKTDICIDWDKPRDLNPDNPNNPYFVTSISVPNINNYKGSTVLTLASPYKCSLNSDKMGNMTFWLDTEFYTYYDSPKYIDGQLIFFNRRNPLFINKIEYEDLGNSGRIRAMGKSIRLVPEEYRKNSKGEPLAGVFLMQERVCSQVGASPSGYIPVFGYRNEFLRCSRIFNQEEQKSYFEYDPGYILNRYSNHTKITSPAICPDDFDIAENGKIITTFSDPLRTNTRFADIIKTNDGFTVNFDRHGNFYSDEVGSGRRVCFLEQKNGSYGFSVLSRGGVKTLDDVNIKPIDNILDWKVISEVPTNI